MIKVNGVELNWEEGMTVEKLILLVDKNKAIMPISSSNKLLAINNIFVSQEEHISHLIQDGDIIIIANVTGGG